VWVLTGQARKEAPNGVVAQTLQDDWAKANEIRDDFRSQGYKAWIEDTNGKRVDRPVYTASLYREFDGTGGIIAESPPLGCLTDNEAEAKATDWAGKQFTPEQKEEVLIRINKDGIEVRRISTQVHGAKA
jgi:hypothetical protein